MEAAEVGKALDIHAKAIVTLDLEARIIKLEELRNQK
jgi:hypothetical protein